MNFRITIVSLVFFFPAVCLYAQEGDSTIYPRKTDRIFTSLERALQNPDSVFRLDLSRKNLKTLPDEIWGFKNLYELNINRNHLKSIPPGIGSCKNLRILKASNNKLKSLPPEIGELKNLTNLELNRNIIERIPSQIGQLKALEKIELWDNEIDSIPDEIKNLKKLKVLELRGILFTDDEQYRIKNLLPGTKIYFSPGCLCKD